MKTTSKRIKTEKLTLTAMMTALVVIFQLISNYNVLGQISSALALIPIAIGAALCGPAVGAWLGLVFAVVALTAPSTQVFFGVSVIGTVVVVIFKGVACGYVSGLLYKLLERKLKFAAAIISSIACPIVNTGIFILGGCIFFMPHIDTLAQIFGMTDKTGIAFLLALALGNFLFELGICTVLSPVIVRLLKIRKTNHD
ncbi:MAG: ECF transporter S component [Eubacteriales bacterium]